MTHIDYPYGFDHRGRTAQTSYHGYVRDLIEQVLFTSPGERVNRPDFGSGLLQIVFDPNSSELAEAVKYTVRAALDHWLGTLIEVEDLKVTSVESTLGLVLSYTIKGTEQRYTDTFERRL